MPSSGLIFTNRSLSIDRAKPQPQFACLSKHTLRRRRGRASSGGPFRSHALLLSDNIAMASVAPRDLCLFNNSDFYHTQQQPSIEREKGRVRGIDTGSCAGPFAGSGRYSLHWLSIKLISARLHAATRRTTRCLALLPRPPEQMTVPEHEEEADADEEISLTDIKMQISLQRGGVEAREEDRERDKLSV